MTPLEILWRARGMLRDSFDRISYPRIEKSANRCSWSPSFDDSRPGFRVTQLPVGAWRSSAAERPETGWRQALVARGDALANGRLTFFDQVNVSLGAPIDWNRDAKSGVRAPLRFAPDVDYRDARESGDCKIVWEPNRHHHLVVLARAYRATGDVRYAEAVCDQLLSWLDACPFGKGMNWRSGLELGVRLINWVWAIDLIQPSGLIRGPLRERLLRSVELHVWEITRKYSRGSSANNHLIGEAAGVYVACAYFNALPAGRNKMHEARTILCAEIERQSNSDGGSREQAFGYQVFVLSLYLAALSAARGVGDTWPSAFWRRLALMVAYLEALSPDGRPLAWYGDADDGYALDLNNEPRAVLTILQWAESLTGCGRATSEVAHWIPLGKNDCAIPEFERSRNAHSSSEFPETGYYMLSGRSPDGAHQAKVLMDCGPLGYGSIAAHGHADALSFTLRAFGVDFFVDPGTYDYFTYPEWRQYFRSTRAHNTIEVDGTDQSEMLGPFLWGKRAKTRVTLFEARPNGGRIQAEHDGYTRLSDPVLHRRMIDLNDQQGVIRIIDEVCASKVHEICIYFHLSESCRVISGERHDLTIEADRGALHLRMDPRLEVSAVIGSQQPILGWVSGGYHRKSPTTTIVGRCQFHGNFRLTTEIALDRWRAVCDADSEPIPTSSNAAVA